ncbi:MAG: PQQ-dependent sugar dehydrogenase, partial [Streptosporangiaceae bacterium]
MTVSGLALGGCSNDPEPAASTTPAAGPATAAPAPAAGKLKLVEVAKADKPVGMALRTGDDTLYVIEQPGRVRAIRDGRLVSAPVLDLTGQVGSEGNEQGLLGLAFSPDGRYVYFDYTGKDGDTRVVEYPVAAGGSIDAGARREVLTQKQPFANHNGGQLAFGPDGFLYIGLGDGGSGGDPQGNGQNLGTWLGKILRIDPRGGSPYRVPASNPFVKKAGAKPEIWAYGLRNPWRFTFDSQTGDLWIGDVGQDAYEEVDFQPAGSAGGENYGWSAREGSHKFKSDKPVGKDPVFDYKLHEGNACSVIAGPVYHGSLLPGLAG